VSRARDAAKAIGELQPVALERQSPAGTKFTVTETVNRLGIQSGVVVSDSAGAFVAHYGSFTLAYRCIDLGLCDEAPENRQPHIHRESDDTEWVEERRPHSREAQE
jgi:hypothetical protein